MGRKICLLTTFMLWMATMVQCNSTTLPTMIACPGTEKLCGNKFCYNPDAQFCSETGSVVTCINVCGKQCYDSGTQVCTHDVVCPIGEEVCEVKYNSSYGTPIETPKLQCYNPQSKRCLNHTICREKDRVCNGQCILYTSYNSYNYQVCANDNKTLCQVGRHYSEYKPNQIQVCNGSCYDTQIERRHCVNGSLQCISDCFNVCYNATTHVCINGTVCYPWQKTCLTNYNFDNGSPLTSSETKCYDPRYSKCIDDALCSNDRICNGQCITGYNAPYTVCANDRHTTCNVTEYFRSYRPYPMHVCNGQCFDTSLQQCINGNVSCIDDICNGHCYNSASYVCLNNTLCFVGQKVCEVKYDSYSGASIESPELRCYDPWHTRCLNHTICYEKDRVCNGQCLLGASYYPYQYQVCANDNKTLCQVGQHYSNYKPNQIQVCNGSCFDVGQPQQYQCLNNAVQCISNCSGTCYNEDQSVCLNGSICSIGFKLCESGSARKCYDPLSFKCLNGTVCSNGFELCESGSARQCYDPRSSKCLNGTVCSNEFELCESGSARQCYNPRSSKCLNGTVCDNSRSCGKQCISNHYQVCANDKQTICIVNKTYNNYKPNQIQLCLGVCYDSSMERCAGEHVVLCIHDPKTQQCLPQDTDSSATTTTTTVASPSVLTGNSISSYAWTFTSDLSTNTIPTNSFILSSNTEASSSSIILAAITSTASPSISSHLSSLSITPTDFSTKPFSYETKTITTTASLVSSDNFTPSLTPSSPSEDTNILPIFSSSSWTMVTTGSDPDDSITSTDTSNPSSHPSNRFTVTAEPHSQTTLSLISTSHHSSSSSSMLATTGSDPDDSITSTDTSSPSSHPSNRFTVTAEPHSQTTLSLISTSYHSSSSSSMLATTGSDPDTSITSIDTSLSSSSHLLNSFIFTTESSSQTTTSSFIPTYPAQESCCATKECTNDTDCCTPHVECRCHRYSRASDDSQACKAIVIGKNSNNSFVIAIALNDEKVIVINHNHFFLLFLSIAITCLLLLLIRISYLSVIHRKTIATNFRLWYLSGKTHIIESERKQWEKYQNSSVKPMQSET